MNRLAWADWIALGPLLAILGGALLILIIESFWEKLSKAAALPLTLATLSVAFFLNHPYSASDNPLLTPWLKFDSFAALFNDLFLVVALASALLASAFFKRFLKVTRGEYYFFLLSATFGLILIGSAANFLTLFLGIETLSLSLYVLAGYMKLWRGSGESSMKYFFMGSLAAAFLLYGIALIYGAAGTTDFSSLASLYPTLTGSEKYLFQGGVALVTLALLFEAAIVPFHFWAPDVYEGAPNPVVAFMATGTKAAAFAALSRLFIESLPAFDPTWNSMVAWIAFFTLIWANLLALKQTCLRRFFAYSGISHAGFLLLPLIATTPLLTTEAFSALYFYLLVYILATLGCFAVLSFLGKDQEGAKLSDLSGLFYTSPFLASLLALSLLTLAGFPPTVGFFAKILVFKVLFQGGYTLLGITALLTTIFSAYYYLRLIGIMLNKEPAVEPIAFQSRPAAALSLATFVLLLLLIFYPGF